MAGETTEVSTKQQVDTKEQRSSGTAKRRQWPTSLKRQIVAETLAPGTSVSVVARRHDVNTNQVFTWRRQLLPKKSAAAGNGTMVPVAVEPVRKARAEVTDGAGVIEITLGKGVRVSIRGEVAAEMLRQVLALLR
jgi:transposase